MIGSIRLGNLRARVAKCRKPKKGDIVIRFDRVNHILGNKYMLYDAANFQERTKVISQYKKDLDIDKIRDFFTKKSISYLKNFIF